METDSTLLNSARMMDKDALEQIFDLYSPALYNYALRLCGDPMLADHIVGDVFVKLLDQLSAGNGPRTNLRSYLYEIAYHRMIDETRYSRRRVSLEVITWFQQDRYSAFPSFEDKVMYKQVLHAIRSELTVDQRHVIVLRFLEEFSLRETAAIIGKRVDHVKVIQGRALAALRRAIEDRGNRKSLSSPQIRSTARALGA